MERILGAIESAKEKAAELNEEYQISSALAERVSATANNIAVTVVDSTTTAKDTVVHRATSARDTLVDRVTSAKETIVNGATSTKDAFIVDRAERAVSRKEPTFEVVSWTHLDGSARVAPEQVCDPSEVAQSAEEPEMVQVSDMIVESALPVEDLESALPVEDLESALPVEDLESALLAFAASASAASGQHASVMSDVASETMTDVFFSDEGAKADEAPNLVDEPNLSSRTSALIVTVVSLLPAVYGTLIHRSWPYQMLAYSVVGSCIGITCSPVGRWANLLDSTRVWAKTWTLRPESSDANINEDVTDGSITHVTGAMALVR